MRIFTIGTVTLKQAICIANGICNAAPAPKVQPEVIVPANSAEVY